MFYSEGVKQDQAPHMCGLILLYTIHYFNNTSLSVNPVQSSKLNDIYFRSIEQSKFGTTKVKWVNFTDLGSNQRHSDLKPCILPLTSPTVIFLSSEIRKKKAKIEKIQTTL